MKGLNGKILEVNLTEGSIKAVALPIKDVQLFLGGRGLGMKLLHDYLPHPGVDPMGPDNVLLFMPGLFCGYPIPSSSRMTMVCKSPMTSPKNKTLKHGSTISYSNVGGFIGAEIKYAGYDGIVVLGKSEKPVYLFVDGQNVELRDASKFWGMGAHAFDDAIIEEVGDRQFESAYIGPGAEKGVLYGSVMSTSARAAGRGGTGAVMGAKMLKAIVVKGNKTPEVHDHIAYLQLLEKARLSFGADSESKTNWRYGGTANALQMSSDRGSMAVKNFSEGTFAGIEQINAHAAREKIWKRDFACFSCHLACKKSGFAKGAYGGVVHEGIEYETGTMLGANLMIDDLNGLHRLIEVTDDYGIDIITAGNVIGFLMECYDKQLIDKDFLDGIELQWGSVDAAMALVHKIGKAEGIGIAAGKGVKHLAGIIGKGSNDFAIHVKGHELAAWNVQGYARHFGISYTTANRGACHMTGGAIPGQNLSTLRDSLGACSFASSWYRDELHYRHFINAITGIELSEEAFMQTGERIFNLEKLLNYREGFRREDDLLPERFFKDAYTSGPQKGVVLQRDEFTTFMDDYYTQRGWNPETTKPEAEKIAELGLGFVEV